MGGGTHRADQVLVEKEGGAMVEGFGGGNLITRELVGGMDTIGCGWAEHFYGGLPRLACYARD